MKSPKTSKSQYLNVLKIDEMIRNKIYPSVRKITKELELSERQVLRILKDLKTNYNAPIEYDRERKGYCYLLDGFSVSDISLNEDEAFALEICNSFISRVFGGSKIYQRINNGLLSLQHRAEIYDNEEGKALAERIHFAIDTTNLGYDLINKQNDFEALLFNSFKTGQILRISRRDWNTRELKQETVLPLLAVMHEGFSWLLFCIKYSAFSAGLKSVDMNLNNFELIPFSDITAINLYKNEHAKTVCIENHLMFPGNTAADCISEPDAFGNNEKKGVALNFSIQFPDLPEPDNEPYEVMIHFEINDIFEYVVTEELLDGAYHESNNPWRKGIALSPDFEKLSEKLII